MMMVWYIINPNNKPNIEPIIAPTNNEPNIQPNIQLNIEPKIFCTKKCLGSKEFLDPKFF